MEDMELVKILWDYMKLYQKLEKCDAILGLGCMDLEVAKIAAKLQKIKEFQVKKFRLKISRRIQAKILNMSKS